LDPDGQDPQNGGEEKAARLEPWDPAETSNLGRIPEMDEEIGGVTYGRMEFIEPASQFADSVLVLGAVEI
jgi:hypothetical protein